MAIAKPLAPDWGDIFRDCREMEEARAKVEYYRQQVLKGQAVDAHRQSILGAFGAQAQQAQPAPKIDLNTHPAYACTLAVAVDLWCAKYGDMWVSLEYIEDTASDDYALYRVLAERLRNAHRMEYMPQMQSYRIILL